MSRRLRKLGLTAHVATSVGWLGSVAGFLTLSIAGLTSSDDQLVRGSYIAMELIGWFVIVPLSIASLLTGLTQSLSTTWGLFRHYWVLAKLLISVVATGLLMLHMKPTSHVAAVALEGALAGGDLGPLRVQLVADAAAAVAVLLGRRGVVGVQAARPDTSRLEGAGDRQVTAKASCRNEIELNRTWWARCGLRARTALPDPRGR